MKKTIHFGTDGVRGNTDQFPFTPQNLERLCDAIALWIKQTYQAKAKVLIGHDSRISCWRIKEIFKESLEGLAIPFEDALIIPTPAILQLIKNDSSFSCGVMISASHNPAQDNGIKLFKTGKGKILEADEKAIEENFQALTPRFSSKNSIDFDTIAQHELSLATPSHYATCYMATIAQHFPAHFLAGKKIVLDCSNGATYLVAPALFNALGAQVNMVGNAPNGLNINKDCGSLFPQLLIDQVMALGADYGFAFDGDGDRVLCVDSQGTIKDGDDILAHLLLHPLFEQSSAIVGTLMTNHGLDVHISLQNKQLIRTKVGDKYVAAELEKQNLLLGGESSGHIIMRDYLDTGDGIFAALRVLEVMHHKKDWSFAPLKKFPQSLINVPIKAKHDLAKNPYQTIIRTYTDKTVGRVIVRYSGTENVLRVMIEDEKQDTATHLAQALARDLQNALNS